MPLTEKGEQIEAHMKAEYGEKKGEQVFYASRNAGTISGVDCPAPAADGSFVITGQDGLRKVP